MVAPCVFPSPRSPHTRQRRDIRSVTRTAASVSSSVTRNRGRHVQKVSKRTGHHSQDAPLAQPGAQLSYHGPPCCPASPACQNSEALSTGAPPMTQAGSPSEVVVVWAVVAVPCAAIVAEVANATHQWHPPAKAKRQARQGSTTRPTTAFVTLWSCETLQTLLPVPPARIVRRRTLPVPGPHAPPRTLVNSVAVSLNLFLTRTGFSWSGGISIVAV